MSVNEESEPKSLYSGTRKESFSIRSSKGNVEIIESFDDLLDFVGSEGRYQKWILYGCVTPLTFVLAAVSYATVYTLYIPPHFCSPGTEMTAQELEEWKKIYIPTEVGSGNVTTYDSCSMYTSNNTDVERPEVACQNGWIYDKEYLGSTIVTQNDWVCDRDFYATTVYMTASAGFLVGNIVFGQLTDKFGRRPILCVSLILYVVFITVAPFLTHMYELYLVITFIANAGFPMVQNLPFLLMAELSNSDYRAWTYTVNWVAWVAGMAALPGVAYFARDWFILIMCLSVPGFGLFFLLPFMPESPRWLITRGRIQDAANIMMRIAKVNGRGHIVDPDEIEITLTKLSVRELDEQSKMLGFWSLFSTKRMAKITCCIAVARASASMVSEQLSLSTPYMSGDPFLNYFIIAVVQLPGTVLAGALVDRTGRRWLPVFSGILLAAACFVVAFLPENMEIIRIGGNILSNFIVSVILYVVYVQQAELFPTPLRATGGALCTTTSSAAALLNPNIVYLRKYYYGAPYLAMAVICIVGSVVASFLPETMGHNLPETIEDVTNFGKGDKYWAFRSKHQKKHHNQEIS